jgi:hypothetical protein
LRNHLDTQGFSVLSIRKAGVGRAEAAHFSAFFQQKPGFG